MKCNNNITLKITKPNNSGQPLVLIWSVGVLYLCTFPKRDELTKNFQYVEFLIFWISQVIKFVTESRTRLDTTAVDEIKNNIYEKE